VDRPCTPTEFVRTVLAELPRLRDEFGDNRGACTFKFMDSRDLCSISL